MFCKVLIFLAISLLVALNEGEVFLVSISTKQYCLGRRLNYFTGNNKLTIGSPCLIADVGQSFPFLLLPSFKNSRCNEQIQIALSFRRIWPTKHRISALYQLCCAQMSIFFFRHQGEKITFFRMPQTTNKKIVKLNT